MVEITLTGFGRRKFGYFGHYYECTRPYQIKLRFGHLKRPPRKYQGERHVIVARELPKQGDQEWVEL